MVQPPQDVSSVATVAVQVPPKPRRTTQRLVRRARIILAIFLTVNIVALSVGWSLNVYRTVPSASRDLTQRLGQLSHFLENGQAYSMPALALTQDDLAHAIADLNQLDGAIPFHGAIGPSTMKRLHQALLLHKNYLTAQMDLLTSIAIMEPYLQAYTLSFLGKTSSTLPLTLDTIHEAQRWLNTGNQLWQQAQQQADALGSQPLAGTLGIDPTALNALTANLRAVQARLQTTFTVASAFLDNTYLIMGIAHPANIFIGMLAPDDLRPLGGAISSYAIAQAQNGTATQIPTFQDITTLDCPKQCVHNPVPIGYQWFTPFGGVFGMRDGGLSRDISGSGSIEHDFLMKQQNVFADAMIFITPTVLAQILALTGPVTVPTLNIRVNADNISIVLAQLHLDALKRANGSGKSISTTPTQESLVLNAISAATHLIPDDALHQLGQTMLHDFITKDVQVFIIYNRVQSQFVTLGLTGLPTEPNTDEVAVVDTNVGQSYSGNALHEDMADDIRLGADGQAQHTLTVTYSLHPGTVATVNELMQVMVPAAAINVQAGGACQPVAISVPESQVVGCRLTITAGVTVQLTFSWSIDITGKDYAYLVRHQAGTSPNVSIVIHAPPGQKITPLSGATSPTTQAKWGITALNQDTIIQTTVVP